jgi:cyanate lyase
MSFRRSRPNRTSGPIAGQSRPRRKAGSILKSFAARFAKSSSVEATPGSGADPSTASMQHSAAHQGVTTMKREQLTETILDIKRDKGWTWKYITDEIGGMSPVLVVGALLGQQKLIKPLARKAAALFGLGEREERMLNEIPMRGMPMPPTDPLIYRFYELIMINGPAWKALIEEEFGDGIMSAIDFDFEMERLADPKGDRVKVSMSGKFLPYKYYGAEQGIQPLGYKEEA